MHSFAADFYLKVSLLQQGRVVKSKKTEVARKSNSPTFNESFTFKLPVEEIDSTSISIAAMLQSSGQRGEYRHASDFRSER